MPQSLTFQSHAKLNLYLDILEQRTDGFHNIETIYQTVSLCDTLDSTLTQSGLTLDCDDEQTAASENNLVMRVARRLQDEYAPKSGAHFDLHKEIPVASGLAGGSGDAAATLLALDELWDLRLGRERLAEIGLEIGSDVPFCLAGGTMGAQLRGEHLLPLAPMPETWFLLIHPPIEVSTAAVYQHPHLPKRGAPDDGSWSDSFDVAVTAISAGDVAGSLHNSMESVVFSMHPELHEIKRRLLKAGCIGALMSGSGPTMYGVCNNREQAERASEAFRDLRRSVVHTVQDGVVRLD